MQQENALSRWNAFLFAAYIIFFASIVFSLRAISSISIGLILIISLCGKKISANYFHRNKRSLLFIASCSLLFFLQCFSLLYTKNVSEGLKLLQKSSGMVVIPFAVFMSGNLFNAERFKKLVFYFAMILSIASLYCIGFASFKYLTGSSYQVFFYHDLVKPLSQHAIQFSIMVFSALLFLIQNPKEKNAAPFHFLGLPMIGSLSFILILLSSKLIICFYVFFLCYIFFNKEINKKRGRVFALCFIISVTGILLIPNPISNRFRAMFMGNAMLFEQKEFNPGIYFNGVQFRLLQWRFTYEILDEQHAWVSGLTPGDAQSFLDKKYIATKMYTGVAGTTKRGFLGYHTHNQFLQVSLENGLPALAIFFFICFTLFKIAGTNNRKELKWLVFLLIVYCFTDAPLATQYGLVIFTFLPMLFYLMQEPISVKKQLTSGNVMISQKTSYANINLREQPR